MLCGGGGGGAGVLGGGGGGNLLCSHSAWRPPAKAAVVTAAYSPNVANKSETVVFSLLQRVMAGWFRMGYFAKYRVAVETRDHPSRGEEYGVPTSMGFVDDPQLAGGLNPTHTGAQASGNRRDLLAALEATGAPPPDHPLHLLRPSPSAPCRRYKAQTVQIFLEYVRRPTAKKKITAIPHRMTFGRPNDISAFRQQSITQRVHLGKDSQTQ